MVENHENYTKIYRYFRQSTNFRRFDKCRKCTELFVFRLLAFPVHFPEITRSSESLIETHGLQDGIQILFYISNSLVVKLEKKNLIT